MYFTTILYYYTRVTFKINNCTSIQLHVEIHRFKNTLTFKTQRTYSQVIMMKALLLVSMSY